MEKFSLNSDGVEAYTAKVYSLTDEKLHEEALLMAGDFRAYVADRFALPIEQLEYLRNLDDYFALMFGWTMAAALLGRRPISISYIDGSTNEKSNEPCTLFTSKLSVHHINNDHTAAGSMAITITSDFCKSKATQ